MNIFVLDSNPMLAAQSLCDKHVVKMTLESTQMLCTVANKLGLETPYKSAHSNHPATVWVGTSRSNCSWAWWNALHISYEYTYRYRQIHKCHSIILDLQDLSFKLPNVGFTPHPLCMPNDLWTKNPTASYRMYYLTSKKHMAQWNKRRKAPKWWIESKAVLGQPQWWKEVCKTG